MSGSVPLAEDYVVPGALVGAYAGITFPRMGFEVRSAWGAGEGAFAYRVQAARIDGLHLFLPDGRFDPFVLYGVGFRATTFPSTTERLKAMRMGVLDTPAMAGFGEAGGGIIIRVVGPVHLRIDARAWLGAGLVSSGEQALGGVDVASGLEIRPVRRPDRDGDGLLDADDACPDEPEDFDHLLDKDGCPEDDVDGDGFPDGSDRCPTRAETVNGYADDDGCPDLAPQVVVAVPPPLRAYTGTIAGIVFALDSAEILPESEPVLAGAAAVLQEYPDVHIAIFGHTDALADDAYNLALSRARAEAVAGWLGAHGVEPTRLRAEGLGETRPVDTNETDAGRARNRRVEFVIEGQ